MLPCQYFCKLSTCIIIAPFYQVQAKTQQTSHPNTNIANDLSDSVDSVNDTYGVVKNVGNLEMIKLF